MPGHLRDDVGRRAEAIQPQPPGIAGHDKRSVADQPRAEQRRGFGIGIALGDGKAEPLVGHGVFGVAAVESVAGEAGRIAKIFTPRKAIRTLAACESQPGHTDSLAWGKSLDPLAKLRHVAHDLMPRHQRQLGMGQFAIDDVQIGAADAAGPDLHENLPRPGLRRRQLALDKRRHRSS